MLSMADVFQIDDIDVMRAAYINLLSLCNSMINDSKCDHDCYEWADCVCSKCGYEA
jgi:hypothetical protein